MADFKPYTLERKHPAEIRTYRLTGISEILGSLPANPDIYSDYIASKAPTADDAEAETADMEDQWEKLQDRGCSVFMRNPRTGCLAIRPYVLKGFFKEMLGVLKTSNKLSAHKSKVDKYVFIQPENFIDFSRDGKPIKEEDCFNERPLLAQTPQGQRSCLAKSEQIDKGWQLEFTVMILNNAGTKSSPALDFDMIESALAQGELQGLGQWRNGGNGRFTAVRIK